MTLVYRTSPFLFLCIDEHKIIYLHTHKITLTLLTSQDYHVQSVKTQCEIILKTVQVEVMSAVVAAAETFLLPSFSSHPVPTKSQPHGRAAPTHDLFPLSSNYACIILAVLTKPLEKKQAQHNHTMAVKKQDQKEDQI